MNALIKRYQLGSLLVLTLLLAVVRVRDEVHLDLKASRVDGIGALGLVRTICRHLPQLVGGSRVEQMILAFVHRRVGPADGLRADSLECRKQRKEAQRQNPGGWCSGHSV